VYPAAIGLTMRFLRMKIVLAMPSPTSVSSHGALVPATCDMCYFRCRRSVRLVVAQ